LSGQEIPDHLPEAAQDVLRGLSWNGGARPPPAPHILTTMRDAPREGPVRTEIRDRIAVLCRRQG